MRRQNEISDEAVELLAGLVDGPVLTFENITMARRKMAFVLDGREIIDNEIIRELRDVKGQSTIWPSHFNNLDYVPHHVTEHGRRFVRSLADA